MQSRRPLLRFGFRDESNTTSTCRFTLQSDISRDAGVAAGTGLRDALQPISDAVIWWQSLTYALVEDEPAYPLPGTNVHQAGIFIFETTEPYQYAIIEIPGVNLVHLMTTGQAESIDIDLNDSAVAALVAQLTSGLWCNRFGYQLVSCVAAFLQWRD